jgi:hypothetical protein
MVVKVKGPFVRHKNDETDDFFLVLHGRVAIQKRDEHRQTRNGSHAQSRVARLLEFNSALKRLVPASPI